MRTGLIGVTSSSASGPGTPGQVLQISGTAGDTEVTLTWSTPISDGGSPITSYTIEYSSNGGSSWSFTTDSGSPHTVTGLSNTVGYIFRIKAENAIGSGPYSPTTATITPYGTPLALTQTFVDTTSYPSTVTTSTATVQTFATLNTVTFTSSSTWSNPYPTGATTGTATLNGSKDVGVLDYVYGTTNGGPYGSTSSTGSLTGLSRGTAYYFKARATPASYTANVTGTVNAGGGSATVSFIYGTTPGGPYPNEVAAVESPVTGSVNTSVSKTLTLTPGTWYVKTKAVNEIGVGYGAEKTIVVSSGVILGSQLSFTPPAISQIIDLDCWGGGGGGAEYVGGGGGGCARTTLSSASISNSVAVTIGAGGSTYGDGSSTSIASLLTAAGGLAGRADFDSPNPSYGGTSGSGQPGGSGGFSFTAGGGGGGGSNGPGQNGYNLGGNYYGGNGGNGWSNPYGQGGGGGGAGTDGEGGNGLGSPQGDGPANTGRGGGGTWYIFSSIEVPGSGGSGYAQFKYYGP